MITVYLSSTFRDLETYRREVLKYFGALKDTFRVLNMEDYVAEDRRAYDKCLEDVRNCDLYLLIIGNSYGSIASDSTDPAFNTEKYSYTELEYREARKAGKEVLVFKASPEAGLPADQYIDRLKAFWTSALEGQLTARDFSSPLHLALQVAQSVSYRFIKEQRVAEKLAYLCDRIPQNSRFMMSAQALSSSFKSVVLYGRTDELCGNFVNRIGFLYLSLDERKLVAPISFDDFLAGDDYEANLQLLLFRIYNKLQLAVSGQLSISRFFTDIQQRPEPLVIVLSCDAEMLEGPQMNFLKKFIPACYEESKMHGGKPFYFFFYLEEDDDAPENLADPKVASLLQSLPEAERFVISLPRLSAINKSQIKQWLREEITPDEGTAEELMDTFFAELPKTNISMKQAHKCITAFIRKMNAGTPETTSFINLY